MTNLGWFESGLCGHGFGIGVSNGLHWDLHDGVER